MKLDGIVGLDEADFKAAADEAHAPLFLAGEHPAVAVISEDRRTITIRIRKAATVKT